MTDGQTPPMENLPIEALALSARALNALEALGFHRVGDLSDVDLASRDGLGRTSLAQIDAALAVIRERVTAGLEGADLDLRQLVDQGDTSASLVRLVPRIAQAVASEDPDDRGYQVLARHYGLFDGERFTLEDIGDFLGITRERARQLEGRVWKRFQAVIAEGRSGRLYRVPTTLVERLDTRRAALVARRETAIREGECHELLCETGQVAPGEPGAVELLMMAWGYEWVTDPGGRTIWCRGLDEGGRSALVTGMRVTRDVLDEEGRALSFFSIAVEVSRRTARDVKADTTRLALELSPEVERLEDDLYRTTLNSLPSLGVKAMRILEEEGSPLHFREIARRINASAVRAGLSAAVSNMQALASQMSGRAGLVPIGRSGSWALELWSNVRTDSIMDLMREALVGRQASSSAKEIHEYVVGFRPDVPLQTVQTLLHVRSDVFIRVARASYELVEWGGKPASRGHRSSAAVTEQLQAAVESLVEDSGATSFELGELITEIVSRGDLPDATVRARIARGSWATTASLEDESVQVEIDLEALRGIDVGLERPAPVTQKVQESVRSFLASQPDGRARVADVWRHVCREAGVKRPTVYKILQEMDGVKKLREANVLYCALEGFAADEALELPGLDLVAEGDTRAALLAACRNLTLESIDVGLFQLGRIFESELRRLLERAGDTRSVSVSKADLSTLSRMIDCVVRLGLVAKGHHLTVLREERNARAHGKVPSEAERRTLLSHAPFIVNLYMRYILQLVEKQAELDTAES